MKGGKNKGDFLCDLKVLELSQNHWQNKPIKGYINFGGTAGRRSPT